MIKKAIWFWRELPLLQGFHFSLSFFQGCSRGDHQQQQTPPPWERPGSIERKRKFWHILTGCLLFALHCDWFTFSKLAYCKLLFLLLLQNPYLGVNIIYIKILSTVTMRFFTATVGNNRCVSFCEQRVLPIHEVVTSTTHLLKSKHTDQILKPIIYNRGSISSWYRHDNHVIFLKHKSKISGCCCFSVQIPLA